MVTALNGGHGSTFLWFWCPGCEQPHSCRVKSSDGTKGTWRWNGDRDKPTLEPSVMSVWADRRCHLYLRDGRVQFLSDSTHSLAGHTVALPELPDWLKD